jgi:cytochrome c oxidase assembly protein subunit 15
VEFINRIVTAAVSLAVALAVLGALVRQPRRRDLTLLSLGLVAGVIAQIVLGGLTVLYKLAPPFVMGHFLLSMALLADAVVLHHRAGLDDHHAPAVADGRDPILLGLARAIVVLVGVVVVAGTVVTSSGPHGGDVHARRFDLSLHRVTQVHGTLAMILAAAVLVALVRSRAPGTPLAVARRAQVLVEALAAQVGVGYAQYFTGVPVLLVGFHIIGAVVVWSAALRLCLLVGEHTAWPAPIAAAVPAGPLVTATDALPLVGQNRG